MPICVFCEEELEGHDTAPFPVGTPEGPRQAHRACMLRSSMGGIGHLIAHQYWCNEHDDPDAGLSYRHSGLLVEAYVHIVGIEETVTRSTRSTVTPPNED